MAAYTYTSIYFDTPIIQNRALDIFEPLPGVPRKEKTLFIVHGGGWRAGHRDKFHQIMAAFAALGYTVASTGYRLNAKDAFEQIKDVRTGYMIFADYLLQQGRKPEIFVYGESAGAHLASMILCSTLEMPEKWIKPYAGILQATPYSFVPWDEMMTSVRNMLQSIAGVSYEKDPEVYEKLSLKNWISADNPPIFFLEAELETMFFPEFTLKAVHQHKRWGINSQWKMYRNMEHGFFYELKRKGQLDAFNDIVEFMEGRLNTVIPNECERYVLR